MKREIKFRAWLANDDLFNRMGMYGPFSFQDIENGRDESNIRCESGAVLQEPDWGKLILMQYTGLKDKNGKEIYEGDIVRYENKKLGEIIQVLESFKVKIKSIHFDMSGAEIYSTLDSKIIGNIYENGDLLNET